VRLPVGQGTPDPTFPKEESSVRFGKDGKIHPSLLVLLVMVLGLLVYLNAGESSDAAPVSTSSSLRETIFVTAMALNAEFEETGTFPADLEVIGMDEKELLYTPESDGYSLVAEDEGIRVEYRFGDDLEPFRSAFEALLPPFRENQ